MIKIGSVCRCRLGRLGVVTSKHKVKDTKSQLEYYGIGLDGKPWQSKEPETVADTINEYIAQKLTSRENSDEL